MRSRLKYFKTLSVAKAVAAIAVELDVDITLCDIFEDVIFLLAGVEELPTRSRVYEEGNTVVFSFATSRDAINTLFKFDTRFPALHMEDVTEKYSDPEIRNDVKWPLELDGKPTILVQMDVVGLQLHILPLFKQYLVDHPEILQRYQRLSYTFSDLYKEMRKIFEPEGVHAFFKGTHCFEDTVCRIIEQSSQVAIKTTQILMLYEFTIRGLIDLINDYVFSRYQAFVPDQKVSIGPCKYDEKDKHVTILGRMPSHTALHYQCFFHSFVPGSAQIKSADTCPIYSGALLKEPNHEKTVQLVVTNQVLLQKPLLSKYKEIVSSFKQDEIDTYRKKSGTINLTIAESVAELERIIDSISKNMHYRELRKLLQKVVNNIKLNKLDKKEALKAELGAIIEHMEVQARTLQSDPLQIKDNLFYWAILDSFVKLSIDVVKPCEEILKIVAGIFDCDDHEVNSAVHQMQVAHARP